MKSALLFFWNKEFVYTEEEEVPSVIVSGFYAQKAYGGGADAVYAYTVMMMIRVRNCVRCYWREKKS